MNAMTIADHTFEVEQHMIDARMLHRPDTAWLFIDAKGHEHRWFIAGLLGVPALSYSPTTRYETPTLVWVKDGEEWWEDSDEPHDVGHLECRQCGEHVKPGYRADDTKQMIPGLASYRIDGVSVSPDEFKARFESARQSAGL